MSRAPLPKPPVSMNQEKLTLSRTPHPHSRLEEVMWTNPRVYQIPLLQGFLLSPEIPDPPGWPDPGTCSCNSGRPVWLESLGVLPFQRRYQRTEAQREEVSGLAQELGTLKEGRRSS